jgi:hypothetical protein
MSAPSPGSEPAPSAGNLELRCCIRIRRTKVPKVFPELALAAAQRRLQQPEADGGELVGLGPIQALGGRDREPVGRHHHGMGHPGVRLAKLSTSQLKSAASLLSWGMAILTRWRR